MTPAQSLINDSDWLPKILDGRKLKGLDNAGLDELGSIVIKVMTDAILKI